MNVWKGFTIKSRRKYISYSLWVISSDDDDDDEFTRGLINVGWFSHLKGRQDVRYPPGRSRSHNSHGL